MALFIYIILQKKRRYTFMYNRLYA